METLCNFHWPSRMVSNGLAVWHEADCERFSIKLRQVWNGITPLQTCTSPLFAIFRVSKLFQ